MIEKERLANQRGFLRQEILVLHQLRFGSQELIEFDITSSQLKLTVM